MINLFKSKKSEVDYYLLITVIALIGVVVVLLGITMKPRDYALKLGDIQVSLLNAYNKADKILFYIDQSAKFSSYKAVKSLADNGGVQTDECGQYLGYKIINYAGGSCLKSNMIKDGYTFLVREEMKKYLNAYPDENMVIDMYGSFITNEEGNKISLYGSALKDLTIDMWNRKGQSFEQIQEEELARALSQEEMEGIEEADYQESLDEESSDYSGDGDNSFNLIIPNTGLNTPITPDTRDRGDIDIKGCPKVPPIDGFVKDTQCLGANCKYIRREAMARLDIARQEAAAIGAKIILSSGWRNSCNKGGRHSTGGAVDIKLIGNGLDCGCMGESGYSRNPCNQVTGGLFAYKDSTTPLGKKIHNCRKTVEKIMTDAGFVNPAELENWRRLKEWWHWEYGTKSWAVAKAEDKKYSMVA